MELKDQCQGTDANIFKKNDFNKPGIRNELPRTTWLSFLALLLFECKTSVQSTRLEEWDSPALQGWRTCQRSLKGSW